MFSAASGELGIELARAHRPNLILMDINLPGIDGFEVLKILKAYQETQDIPIVAISANAMAKDIERAIAAGFAEYIIKPINVSKFINLLVPFLN